LNFFSSFFHCKIPRHCSALASDLFLPIHRGIIREFPDWEKQKIRENKNKKISSSQNKKKSTANSHEDEKLRK